MEQNTETAAAIQGGACACKISASTKDLINFIYGDMFPQLDGLYNNLCEIAVNNTMETDPDGARFTFTDERTKEVTKPVFEALAAVKDAAREVLNTFMMNDYSE